jgi:cell division protein FtsL
MNTLARNRFSVPSLATGSRQVEGEGILRMLLLAFALALPLASVIYLKIQNMRISYEMGEVKRRIHEEEETQRQLQLVRSKYQRDEEVQSYATRHGLQPRKQGHLVPKAFTPADQRLAKLGPVGSGNF